MEIVGICRKNPSVPVHVYSGTGKPTAIIEISNRIFGLVAGLLHEYDKKDLCFKTSQLCHSKLTILKSSFGTIVALTEAGDILINTSRNIVDLISITLVKKNRDLCPHGVKFDDFNETELIDVDNTKTSIFAVDTKGRCWTFSRASDFLKGTVLVSLVPFVKKVLRVFCGRAHMIALCENQIVERNTSLIDESSESLLSPMRNFSQKTSPSTNSDLTLNEKCDKCLSDSSLRLSILMEQAESGASNATPLSPILMESASNTPTTKKSKLAKFRNHFFGSSFKKEERPIENSVWHTTDLPSGASLSRSRDCQRHASENGDVDMSHDSLSPMSSLNHAASTDLTGIRHFSFVELNRFVQNPEGSSSTATTPQPSLTTMSDGFDATGSSELPIIVPKTSSSVLPLIGELYSWGQNTQGQLGHSDTISKSEPTKIRGIPTTLTKICVGADHNIVLAATGEAYVWGLNSAGQLKVVNQSCLLAPTLLKLGAGSSIVDVAACYDSTTAIVSGQSRKTDSVPLVYIFGNGGNEKWSATTVCNAVEKLGYPIGLLATLPSAPIWIAYLPKSNPEAAQGYIWLQLILKAAKFAKLINNLAEKLLFSPISTDTNSLLRRLSTTSSAWSLTLAKYSSACQKSLSTHGDPTLAQGVSALCHFHEILRAMLEYHFAVVDVVSFRIFYDIVLEFDVQAIVEKLCFDYGIENSCQHYNLRQLFELPIHNFVEIRKVLDSIKGDTLLAANFWKYFDRTIERNLNFVTQTCQEVIELQKYVTDDIQLSKPSRLVIWSSTSNPNNAGLKIKETDAGAAYFSWRNVLSTTSSGVVLAVFSDAIAVLLRNQAFILNTPLVWVQNASATALAEGTDDSTDAENDLIVELITPEHRFLVEFPKVDMKNDLLTAFLSSWIYSKEKNDLCIFNDQTSLNGVPVKRTGSYEFSTTHPIYKGARYTGEWKNGKPHGDGLMIFTDGKEYKGSFVHGEMDGHGEMTVPEDRKIVNPMTSVFYSPVISDRVQYFKGRWKSGKLNGLAVILYVNGEKYEGYCVNGKPHGHGVYRSRDSAGSLAIYVGGWSNGQRHGYGVYSVSKDRYLGMWNNGQRHDRGCHITIDGVFHEGIFDKDRFIRGRLVTDSLPKVSFEGEFEKLGYAAGKGMLKLTPDVVVDGTISGQILSDSLTITHAICKRTPQQERDGHGTVNIANAESMLIDNYPTLGTWAVHPDLKWKEIFDCILNNVLGFEIETIQLADTKRAWDRLASIVDQIKTVHGVTVDDDLEKVPDFEAEWSLAYYKTVKKYWNLFLKTKHHPIQGLFNGLIEIFCNSYNNLGIHEVMFDSAVLEITSFIKRTYDVIGYLFPSLPPKEDMYQAVPEAVVEESSTTSEQGNFNVPTPACEFVLKSLFSKCYADLFTMYTIKSQDLDQRYWYCVSALNSVTDVRLLKHFGVDQSLWPMFTSSGSDELLFTISSRRKFYESAVVTLQSIGCKFTPSDKLQILTKTFSDISECVSQFSSAGPTHMWSGDDLLPAFMYVVVRAQLRNLGAEIRLISDFSPGLRSSGQLSLMFTMLCASYIQIIKEQQIPS